MSKLLLLLYFVNILKDINLKIRYMFKKNLNKAVQLTARWRCCHSLKMALDDEYPTFHQV